MTLHSKLPADAKGAKLGQCKQKGLVFNLIFPWQNLRCDFPKHTRFLVVNPLQLQHPHSLQLCTRVYCLRLQLCRRSGGHTPGFALQDAMPEPKRNAIAPGSDLLQDLQRRAASFNQKSGTIPLSETTRSCHGGLNTYFPGESAIPPAQPLADDLEDELPGPSTTPWLARSMASAGTQPFCQRPEALLPRCLRGAHPRFFM